jgi:hypothetical protein
MPYAVPIVKSIPLGLAMPRQSITGVMKPGAFSLTQFVQPLYTAAV